MQFFSYRVLVIVQNTNGSGDNPVSIKQFCLGVVVVYLMVGKDLPHSLY